MTITPYAHQDLPIDLIKPGNNSRSNLSVPKALINSIKEAGIINPISVKSNAPDEENYTIIAGHRRHAAATKAGLTEIPCVVYNGELKDGDEEFIALAENHHRLELSDLDYADAFSALSNKTDKEIADLFGVTAWFVKQRRALSSIHPKLKKWIRKNDITMRDAERIASLHSQQQKELAKHIAKPDFNQLVWDAHRTSTKMRESEALFQLKDYDGLFTEDLFNDVGERYFADPDQAALLQKVSVEKWIDTLKQVGWEVEILKEGNYHWDTHSGIDYAAYLPESVVTKYQELLMDYREKPRAFLSYLSYHIPKVEGWNEFTANRRTIVVSQRDGKFRFDAFLKSRKSSTLSTESTAQSKPKYGPTLLQAMAAHKGDILTESWLNGPADSAMQCFTMAAVILQAGDISLSHSSYSDKVEDRREVTRPTVGYFENPQDILVLMQLGKEDLLSLFTRVVGAKIGLMDALPGTKKRPTIADVMAQVLEVSMWKKFQPTEQVLRQFNLKELQKWARKHKLAFHKASKKKDMIGMLLSFYKKNPGVTYCPNDFEFTSIDSIKHFDIERKFGISVKAP